MNDKYEVEYTVDYSTTKTVLLNDFQLTDEVQSVKYKKNGKLHREDGPAILEFYKGICNSIEFALDNKIMKLEEFVQITNKSSLKWDNGFYHTKDGVLHREDGPAYTLYDIHGDISSEKWCFEGKLHREDGPAESWRDFSVQCDDDGIYTNYSYYKHGVLHNEDGPAQESFFDNGDEASYSYYIDGVLHNEYGPAVFAAHDYYGASCFQGMEFEAYYVNGKLHREDGPAKIDYFTWQHGDPAREEYYHHGVLHNEDGPAVITYADDDSYEPVLSTHEWYHMGERHREDGPALFRFWDQTNYEEIYEEEYWKHGKQVFEDGNSIRIKINESKWVNFEDWEEDITYIKEKYGNVSSVEHYKDGVLHREDGPAVYSVDYDYDTGKSYIRSEYQEFYIEGNEIELEEFISGLNKNHYKKDGLEVYLKDGKFHREDGPAVIKLQKDNKFKDILLQEEWYLNGKLHREDGPAKISYKDDGSVYHEEWYLNDELHREDGPAYISYKDDGSVFCEEWYFNGKQHCEDGPAEIWYNNDGSIDYKKWYSNGEKHREDGPAYIRYNDDGDVSEEYWYLNGKLHSEDGPAVVDYSQNGNVSFEIWYLNGEQLSEDEFNKRIKEKL